MSKRAIVSYDGTISEVVEAGDEFEIYEGDDAKFVWMDVPDDVTITDSMRCFDGVFKDVDSGETVEYLRLERLHAYGSVGDQLDMMYKDKLNSTTTWDDHVAEVKKLPKPSTGNSQIEDPEPRLPPGDGGHPHWKKK